MHRGFRGTNARRLVRLWPLLAAVGLLIVPVECARVGHPHSLYQELPGAATELAADWHAGHADGTAHSAHAHTEVDGDIPAWASPLEYVEPAITTAPSFEVVAATVALLRTVLTLIPDRQEPPQLEPLAPVAEIALGTPIATLIALLLLAVPSLCGVADWNRHRLRPFISLLEPPPPRPNLVAI